MLLVGVGVGRRIIRRVRRVLFVVCVGMVLQLESGGMEGGGTDQCCEPCYRGQVGRLGLVGVGVCVGKREQV